MHLIMMLIPMSGAAAPVLLHDHTTLCMCSSRKKEQEHSEKVLVRKYICIFQSQSDSHRNPTQKHISLLHSVLIKYERFGNDKRASCFY